MEDGVFYPEGGPVQVLLDDGPVRRRAGQQKDRQHEGGD